jgi:poly(beta-D-mannuronate) C5 epimerase
MTTTSRRTRRAWAIGVAGTLAAGVTAAVAQTPAEAAACTSPVKYAPTSNTVYLLTAQTWTPSSIKAACPQAPLEEVDPAHQVWELRGDLVVSNGATLALHSSTAATPGDVDVLRLRSLASNAPTEVSAITARWGTIDVDGVDVTSWDDAANRADTDPSVPAGATGVRGRAYLRAQSYLDSGIPRLSTMRFANATVENLGWYGAESYGVSWKSLGCVHGTGLATCAAAPVTGGATNTRFLRNYMGSYVWGGHAMTFRGNLFDQNVMYGLDTHDVTTDLDVERNRFSNNGDHGFICSQQCDHLTVVGNESDHNGMTPWPGPSPSGEIQAGQVHGIMLHRGITNTVVADNRVHDQPNGAGIAVFDTSGQTIRNNTVTGNRYGLRISVGSTANVFASNVVTGSGKYAVYTYKGSDVPTYATTTGGHPTGNVFTGNTLTGSGVAAVNLNETDDTSFGGSTFGGGAIRVSQSAGTRIAGAITDGQAVQVVGSSTEPSDVKLVGTEATTTATIADAYSKENITSAAGRLFLVGGAAYAQTVTPTGSTVTLTSAKLGTTGTVAVMPSAVTVLPTSSSVKASAVPGSSPKVTLTAATAGVNVTVTVRGLRPSATYTISGGTSGTTTAAASASGVVTFSRTLGTTAATTYTVTPA